MRARWMTVAGLAVAAAATTAQVPSLVNYQARLLNGTNLYQGVVELRLRLYSSAAGGTPLYANSNAVSVVDGLYSAYLGTNTTSGSLAAALTNEQVWIEVVVNGTVLTPRERLSSAPYALLADAVRAGGVTAPMLAAGAVTGAKLASNAVGAVHLAPGAVTAPAIANNAVGSAHIAYGAVQAEDIADHAITSHQLASARYLQVLQVITNPTPENGDNFGFPVAQGGGQVFIAAPGDNTGAANAGCVYRYDLTTLAYLGPVTNPAPAANEDFAVSIAWVGASRLAVGATHDDTAGVDTGTVYLFDSNGVLQTTLTNPTPTAQDEFGCAVARVGANRLAVGARRDDVAGMADVGTVCLFDLNGALLVTVTNPTPFWNEHFGASVAAVGDTGFVVGAPDDGAGASQAGRAYLFDTDGHLLVTLTNPSPATVDLFGCSVAGLGADRIMVGAMGKDVGGVPNAGAAFLYDLSGRLLATLTREQPAASDVAGEAVRGWGTEWAVLDVLGQDSGAPDAGAIHVFDRDGRRIVAFINPSPQTNDYFGADIVGLDADRLLVGALGKDIGAPDAGAAYVLRMQSGIAAVSAQNLQDGAVQAAKIEAGAVGAAALATQAVQTAHIAPAAVQTAHIAPAAVTTGTIAPHAIDETRLSTTYHTDGTASVTHAGVSYSGAYHFGLSLAGLAGTRMAVGCPWADNEWETAPYTWTHAGGMGAVYVYDGAGQLLMYVQNPVHVFLDEFGYAVAAAGADGLLVGAPGRDAGATDAGVAYLFDAAWALSPTITNPAPAAGDGFGSSVAGVGATHLVVGAPADDAGGADSGSVYLYGVGGALVASIANPSPGLSNGFGSCLAAVGSDRFAAGAPRNDAGSPNAGAVYVFGTSGALLLTITNPAPAAGDGFGGAVATVGNGLILVGAAGDDAGGTDAGCAYLYSAAGTLLVTITNPTPASGDAFGAAVSGGRYDTIWVGAPGRDAGPPDAGTVYVFDLGGRLLQTLTPAAPVTNDHWGAALGFAAPDLMGIGCPDYDAPGGNTDFGYATLIRHFAGAAAVVTEAIRDGAVTAAKIAAGAVGVAALGADVDSRYVNAAGDIMSGPLNMGGQRITGVGPPAAGTDAVNRDYVDGRTGWVPVGAILAWAKNLGGVPALPAGFVECNGQVLSDTGSPLNGQTMPNLNGSGGVPRRFLRGATASGASGGLEEHAHSYSGLTGRSRSIQSTEGDGYQYSMISDHQHGLDFTVSTNSSLPSYYEVVWIMRVK